VVERKAKDEVAAASGKRHCNCDTFPEAKMLPTKWWVCTKELYLFVKGERIPNPENCEYCAQ